MRAGNKERDREGRIKRSGNQLFYMFRCKQKRNLLITDLHSAKRLIILLTTIREGKATRQDGERIGGSTKRDDFWQRIEAAVI